ncbi:MAG: ChbG/HpnK family deacetylase [Elusimicrobia bacterium]|nr:ChbG/HpnK family deacetylase [Elusimicrobiota bacterium]
MSRRLILTADDFGCSREVNEGVLQACRGGVLRHASLMVGEDSAEEAARRSKSECPALSVGLHLVLAQGRAVSPRSADALAPGGVFPAGPALCGLRYFFRGELAGALENEMRAQFERFLSFGLSPSHVDGHANIHAHPVVFPMLLRLAREYAFKRVRLPGGELRRALSYRWRPFLAQLGQGLIFALLERHLRSFPGSDLCPERCWGLLRSGLMTEAYLLHLLRDLPEGVTEIYFHPTSSPETVPVTPTPSHRSRLELEALTSPRVKEAIRAEGIELV